MNIAYVGLGSNLDDPIAQLSMARSALQRLPQTTLLRYSSCYLSRPLGPQDQPDFINAVAKLETSLPPLTLLAALLKIEMRQGRIRTGQRWGPRTLDLDLLLYGDQELHEEKLIIPHPQMSRRNFVLGPLVEIAPQAVIPGHGPACRLLEKVGNAGLQMVEHSAWKNTGTYCR